MERKDLTKNYIYNLVYQILVLILPLVTTPYISRILGAENIGIYGYTSSIAAYFILFGSLGIALYGQREIAYYQQDKKIYSIIFWEIVCLRIVTMIISLLFYYFNFARTGEYAVFYRILIIEITANTIDISWFFHGLEEFKKIIVRNLIVKFICVICIFIFVRTKEDLKIYFLIYTLSLLVGNLSLWMYLPRILEKVQIKELKILRHLRPTIILFLPQIAIQVYTILDKTMIGTIIADKSEVGYYEQSQKIVKMLLTVVTSLGTVMLPRIANTFINGKREKVQEYLKKSFNLVFMLAFPIIFGIFIVSDTFVPIFFGEGYENVSILMKIISPIILFIGISNIIGMQYLLPTKRQKEYTISVVVGAIVNLIVNSILIKPYGAMGAAIGTVIAEFCVTFVQIWFTRKEISYIQILELSLNYIIAVIIMFLIGIFLNMLNLKPIIKIVIQVIICAITYLVMLLILKDKFANEILNKIFGRLRNNKSIGG